MRAMYEKGGFSVFDLPPLIFTLLPSLLGEIGDTTDESSLLTDDGEIGGDNNGLLFVTDPVDEADDEPDTGPPLFELELNDDCKG